MSEAKTKVSDELDPVVRVGNWVRLKAGKGVPARVVNRDLIVVNAPIRRTVKPTKQSNSNVEFQNPGDPLLVRNRDTGEEFEVTRSQVERFATERAEFGGR